MSNKKTKFRLDQVTKRLDHMVPDIVMSSKFNNLAAKELEEISTLLMKLLPDPSLSPDERLERLARVVQERIPEMENLLSASQKVHKLKRRIDELVPNDDMTHTTKIEYLVKSLESESNKSREMTIAQKLELLGDPRANIDPVE